MHQVSANNVISHTLQNHRSLWSQYLFSFFFLKQLYTLRLICGFFLSVFGFLFCFLLPTVKASGHSKSTKNLYSRALALSLKPQLQQRLLCGRLSQNSWGRLLSDYKVTWKAGGFPREEQPEEQEHYTWCVRED